VDVTQIIGPHRVRCGDLESFDLNHLMNGEKAAVIYSDPPWGPGNLRYWRTMNKQDFPGSGQERWVKFLAMFASAVDEHLAPDGVALIEMGNRWRTDLTSVMEATGFAIHGTWTILYGSPKRPNLLMAFARKGIPKPSLANVQGFTGFNAVLNAVRPVARPGEILLDPCCGLGNSAEAAMETGMVFRGMELNPARLARTVKRLQEGTRAR